MSTSQPTSCIESTLKSSGELVVRVGVGSHANCDSLPLRFGLHFQTDTLLTLRRARFLRDDGEYPDRCHVDADFQSPHGTLTSGHFVLGVRNASAEPFVVTVWRHDIKTEFYLSEVMILLRERGLLKPAELLELHPLYTGGKLRSHADLVEQLSLKMTNARVTELKSAAAEANERAEEANAAREKAERMAKHNKAVALEATYALDESECRVKDLTADNERLTAENERFKKEKAAARQEGQDATLSSPDTLVEVQERQQHKGSNCTILVMADGTRRYMKVATFDPDGRVTRKAKSLVGRRVRVSCWDPINEPGKWTRLGYFRNIYAVE